MQLFVPPRVQKEIVRLRIERHITELQAKLVPGLKASTAQLINEQILELEAQLAPQDDKRDPRMYRRKPEHTESWPVRKWNRDDWLAATWAAGKRSQGWCELCAGAASAMYRLVSYPDNHQITQNYVEAVCQSCADAHPRAEVCPFG